MIFLRLFSSRFVGRLGVIFALQSNLVPLASPFNKSTTIFHGLFFYGPLK